MKSFRRIASYPVSMPLSPDEIVEFHLARILLLISICGRSGRISGLTKFAKLDFFARYSNFFRTARSAIEPNQQEEYDDVVAHPAIESSMVRHHYGPWDKRYYHILAHLSAKGLIHVTKSNRTYNIALTDEGKRLANMLKQDDAFETLVQHMGEVSRSFGGKNGTFLKNLIYRVFDQEVADRPLGEGI